MKVKLSNPVKNMYGDPLQIGNGVIEVNEKEKAIQMLLNAGAIDPIYEEVKKEVVIKPIVVEIKPVIVEVPKPIIIEEKPKVIVIEEKPKKYIYTKVELKKMNKAQQTEILKGYGFIKVPSLEADRIELIMNVQKKG